MTLLEAYIANIARLDVLADQGLNDSSEADAIRDDMDGQWARMTEAERDKARGYAMFRDVTQPNHVYGERTYVGRVQ